MAPSLLKTAYMAGRLHKKEAEETVSELFEMLKSCEAHYMNELYVFAFATKKTSVNEIVSYTKTHNVKIDYHRAYITFFKIQFRNILKKLYHKFR